MKNNKSILFLLAPIYALVFFPMTTLAYIDPGTGSLLLQILGIAFVALGGFWIAFKNKIKSFFGKKNAPDKEQEDDTNEEE